jgi:hypothetical protein
MALLQDLTAQLRRLYQEEANFARVFDHLASRDRNRSELLKDRLAAEPDLEDIGPKHIRARAIWRLFKSLEDFHLGQRILGRGGKKSRFRWNDDVEMLEVAAAARGVAVPPRAPAAPRLDDIPANGKAIRHQYALRPDFAVALELPVDLLPAEAERLSAFVRTLPFTSNEKGERL